MKIGIFSFVRVSENSMVASVRIARYLADKFGCELHCDEQIDNQWDLLIIVNGAYGFSKYLESLASAVKRARQIVFVQNDYTIVPPKIESKGLSPFRAAFRERHEAGKPHMNFWTTCADWQAFTPASRYVNWNSLTFDESVSTARVRSMRKIAYQNLFYYGSYRGGGGKSSRERYFDRYFLHPEVKTLISSPAKQFRERYPDKMVIHVEPIREDFSEFLGKQGLGLYIEDRMSHERFHSPANRFYEMLSAGLPMVFQPECGNMMRRAGYDPEPYFVQSARSIRSMLDSRDQIGQRQRAEWIGDDPGKFRRVLETQIDDALSAQMEALKS